jgi:hypothetical protein
MCSTRNTSQWDEPTVPNENGVGVFHVKHSSEVAQESGIDFVNQFAYPDAQQRKQ